MNQKISEPTSQAERAGVAAGGVQPTPAKIRRPRRMAREIGGHNQPVSSSKPAADKPTMPKGESKIAKVIALLGREQGATLAELVEATGWLAHTTRAALTGLRKKGHVLEKTKRGEVTCYKLAKPA